MLGGAVSVFRGKVAFGQLFNGSLEDGTFADFTVRINHARDRRGRRPAGNVALLENRDHWNGDAAGQVHGAGIAADEKIEVGNDCGKFSDGRLADDRTVGSKLGLERVGHIGFVGAQESDDVISRSL